MPSTNSKRYRPSVGHVSHRTVALCSTMDDHPQAEQLEGCSAPSRRSGLAQPTPIQSPPADVPEPRMTDTKATPVPAASAKAAYREEPSPAGAIAVTGMWVTAPTVTPAADCVATTRVAVGEDHIGPPFAPAP